MAIRQVKQNHWLRLESFEHGPEVVVETVVDKGSVSYDRCVL